MATLVWVSENGRKQKITQMHDNHLINAISKCYRDAEAERSQMRKTPKHRRNSETQKTLAFTKRMSAQDFAHRVYPELDALLREAWRRGLVKAPE